MGTRKYEPIQCPRCGSTVEPTVTNNCYSIVHPIDKQLAARGITVPPHIDVEYICSCGFARHVTLSCDGKEISRSDVLAY